MNRDPIALAPRIRARSDRLPEAFVVWLWENRLFRPELTTTAGQGVQVIYPGWRWGSWGPDFHAALLSIEGQVLRGDVEVHVDARDWHRHGHATDPAYMHTILHVVFDRGPTLDAVRADGQRVATVCLGDHLAG